MKSVDKPGWYIEELDGHAATAAANGVVHAEGVCPGATLNSKSPNVMLRIL